MVDAERSTVGASVVTVPLGDSQAVLCTLAGRVVEIIAGVE
jgi:hypothetical protein